MALSLTIEELNTSDPLRVVLEADDAPHGRRYEKAAWEEVVEVKLGEEDGIRVPGRSRPVYPVLYTKLQPRTFTGHLRDRLTGRAGGAQQTKTTLKRIADRTNGQRVTYGEDGFDGLLVLARFGIEDPDGDITYELTFSVAEEHGHTDAVVENEVEAAGPDLVAQLAADAAEVRAQQATLAIESAVQQALALQWSVLDDFLDAVGAAVSLLESGSIGQAQQVRQTAQRAIGNAKAVQDRATDFAAAVRAFDAGSILEDDSAGSLASFETWRASLLADMLALRDGMRSVARQARQKLVQTTKLYQVRPGDTLDQVAQAALGQRGRAADLGLTQAQLTAREGRYIRIPSG